MKPNKRFTNKKREFWANVRTISQEVGYSYSTRSKSPEKGMIKAPTIKDMIKAYKKLKLDTFVLETNGRKTNLASNLIAYFKYRKSILEEQVSPKLMDVNRASAEFHNLKKKLNPSCPLPMNKQKKEKRDYAFLTCLTNMLIEEGLSKSSAKCDYDPKKLTTIIRANKPLRTLARRVDGAYPESVNPTAIWEIKEYYYTTTFGSRVADGVYESLLDGMELEELAEKKKIKVLHYLMVDGQYTWWKKGKSYLCRIIDMLHMGYVDEVLFGYEVIERMPDIVNDWLTE
jgi:hypothetical protein